MFLRWFNICMRCQQRSKGQVNECFCEDLCKWHGLTREHLIRTGFNDAYYDKCENFCQTIYLTLIRHHSYLWLMWSIHMSNLNINTENKWIAWPGSSLDKRQSILQIMVHAEGEKPRMAFIFCSQGKQICPDEKNAWHQDVNVFWQKNASANTEMSLKGAKGTLIKSLNGLDRFVLYLYNLRGKESDSFKSAVAELNCVVWFGLKNAIELWQVVDAGLA